MNLDDFDYTGETRGVNPGEFYAYAGEVWQNDGVVPTFFRYEILKPKEKGMKLEDCKVGMKVRLKPGEIPGIKKLVQDVYPTLTGKITSIFGAEGQEVIIDGMWGLSPDQLEPYEEKPMKYKELKCIRAATVIAEKPDPHDFATFIDAFGYEPVSADDFVVWCENNRRECWISWAISNGFIEEVKEEKTYYVGQRFDGPHGKYLLCTPTDASVSMINLKTGSGWGNPIRVGDTQEILHGELTYYWDSGFNLIQEFAENDLPF